MNFLFKNNRHMKIFAVLFVIAAGLGIYDALDTVRRDCKITGEQRLVNGVDGPVVMDKAVCRKGEVKWIIAR